MEKQQHPDHTGGGLSALKGAVLFLLGAASLKVIDIKLFKFEVNWSDPTHLKYMAVLLASTTAAGVVAAIYFKVRYKQESERVTSLITQVDSVKLLLEDTTEKKALEGQVVDLKEQLDLVKKRTYQFLEFEGIYLPSLMAYMHESDILQVNAVQLEEWKMHLKLGANNGGRHDMHVTYDLKGRNAGATNLITLQFRISGDSAAKKEDLHLRLVETEPTRRNLAVKVVSDRERTKVLELEFAAPGIPPNHNFHISFSFSWPRIFQLPKDYWFLDNVNFLEATKKIVISVEFDPLTLRQASVYSISRNGKDIVPCGSAIIDTDNPRRTTYEKVGPEKDAFYLILLECDSLGTGDAN